MSKPLAEILTDVTIREGSQQERDLRNASIEQKVAILQAILNCGVRSIEITGFAPGAWFSDADALAKAVQSIPTSASLHAIYFNTAGAESLSQYPHFSQEGLFHTAATTRYREENYKQRSVDHALTKLERMLTFFQSKSLNFDTCILSTAWGEEKEPVESDSVLSLIAKITQKSTEAGLPLKQLTLADTVGNASPQAIGALVRSVKAAFPELLISLHLHPHPSKAHDSVVAGLEAGVDRWEGAWGSLGGSPFASGCGGNLDLRTLVAVYGEKGLPTGFVEEKIPSLMKLLTDVCGRDFSLC